MHGKSDLLAISNESSCLFYQVSNFVDNPFNMLVTSGYQIFLPKRLLTRNGLADLYLLSNRYRYHHHFFISPYLINVCHYISSFHKIVSSLNPMTTPLDLEKKQARNKVQYLFVVMVMVMVIRGQRD